MVSMEMYELGAKSSVIREIFEFGKKRAAEIGKENVYDYEEHIQKTYIRRDRAAEVADVHCFRLGQDRCFRGFFSAIRQVCAFFRKYQAWRVPKGLYLAWRDGEAFRHLLCDSPQCYGR